MFTHTVYQIGFPIMGTMDTTDWKVARDRMCYDRNKTAKLKVIGSIRSRDVRVIAIPDVVNKAEINVLCFEKKKNSF